MNLSNTYIYHLHCTNRISFSSIRSFLRESVMYIAAAARRDEKAAKAKLLLRESVTNIALDSGHEERARSTTLPATPPLEMFVVGGPQAEIHPYASSNAPVNSPSLEDLPIPRPQRRSRKKLGPSEVSHAAALKDKPTRPRGRSTKTLSTAQVANSTVMVLRLPEAGKQSLGWKQPSTSVTQPNPDTIPPLQLLSTLTLRMKGLGLNSPLRLDLRVIVR